MIIDIAESLTTILPYRLNREVDDEIPVL